MHNGSNFWSRAKMLPLRLGRAEAKHIVRVAASEVNGIGPNGRMRAAGWRKARGWRSEG